MMKRGTKKEMLVCQTTEMETSPCGSAGFPEVHGTMDREDRAEDREDSNGNVRA
jgi:hypothetical protein